MDDEKTKRRAKAKLKGCPDGAQVRAARAAAGHSVTAAAKVIYCGRRQWHKYEVEEAFMPKASFELYRIKTGQF